MKVRSGSEYLAGLQDKRVVFLDGIQITDVSSHPAFAPAAARIAELFDIAADPSSGMTVTGPDNTLVNRVFTTPRSREDLAAFGTAVRTWARHTHGWLGRGPDYMGALIAAFAAHLEVFADQERDLSENVAAFHQRMLTENLHVASALLPPQSSRVGSHRTQVGVHEERTDGVIVRGAQMLATGGAVADEIFVSCIKPLADRDRDAAISFVVPADAPGLRMHSRRSYASAATSTFDYPMSSRYDETDCFLVFDDVLIPWERVFVYRDTGAVRVQFFDTGAHLLGNWQAQIRFSVKLRFLVGLAGKLARANGLDGIPAVIDRLGELAALSSLVESATQAAEYMAAPDPNGMWRPGARAVYGAMGMQAELYPRALGILRELVGGGVFQVPASVSDLLAPATRTDFERYVHGNGTSAAEHIKLCKLVWDVVGSEFAGRHHQYEMFYAGAPFVARAYAYRNYGFDGAITDVETFLAGYTAHDDNDADASQKANQS
jgi:4-hydroxyphenylacetate 3-monooxygenase